MHARLHLVLGLSLLAVSASLCSAEAPLPPGLSDFTLPNEGEPLRVFAYKPPTYTDGPLVVVVHGSDRNASEHRDWAINLAERFGVLVVAPEFDKERFNDERYKRTLGGRAPAGLAARGRRDRPARGRGARKGEPAGIALLHDRTLGRRTIRGADGVFHAS